MREDLDHIYHAVQLLVGRDVTLDDRFHEAANEFVAACRRAGPWPENLRTAAEKILGQLTREGSIDATIDAMDAATADALADSILDLSEALTVLCSSTEDRNANRREAGKFDDEFGEEFELDGPSPLLSPSFRKRSRHRLAGRSHSVGVSM